MGEVGAAGLPACALDASGAGALSGSSEGIIKDRLQLK